MTAKLKAGYDGGEPVRGADPDTPHVQLMKEHRGPPREEGASVHSMGDTRDDAGNADADMPWNVGVPLAPPKGGKESDLPDPFPEKLASGEGSDIDDDDDKGLGPPSGHGD